MKRTRSRMTSPVLAALLALAGGAVPSLSPTIALAQQQAIEFDIPSQPLARALAAYGRATTYQVSADAALLRGRTAPAVSGRMLPGAALDRLLAGSGLYWRRTGPGRFVVQRAAPLSTEAGGDDVLVLDPIGVRDVSAADAPFREGAAVAHISEAQIQRRRGASPGDIFKGTPGVVAAANHNGSQLDVNIRGMQGQNRVKVAIDGTQQTSTTWRGYIGVDERVYLDPDLIADIDISKGPSGSAEGAGTPGGVVSVRTLTAKDVVPAGESQGWRLRLGTSDNAATAPDSTPMSPVYDQRTDADGLFDGNYSGSLVYGRTGESVDVLLAYARRKRGNYFAGEHGPTTYAFNGRDYNLSFTRPGEEVFNSSEDSRTLMGKTTLYWGDGHALQLGYTQHDTEFGESMGSLLFMQDNGFRQVKLSDITAKTYTARYKWQPATPLIDLEASLWATDVSGTTRAVSGAIYIPPYVYPADEPRYSETLTYGADITNTSRTVLAGRDLTLRYGLSYQLEDMDAHAYCSRSFVDGYCVDMKPSKGTRRTTSAFSTAKWELSDSLTLNAGLRYDAWRLEDKQAGAEAQLAERDGGRLNGSLGATWEALPGIQVFGRYAEGVRPPTLRETMGSDANAIPNPDLEAEVTRTLELGANLLRRDVLRDGDSLGVKLSAFHNRHDDYVSRVPSNAGPGEPVFTFANLDSASFTGVELSGRYDSDLFFAEASATHYLDYEFCYTAECQDVAVQYDYATNHLPPELMVSLTLGVKLMDERLTLGTTIDHASARMAPLTTSDRQRTAVWRPYTVGTLFASYDLSAATALSMRVENLTDRYYIDALDGWTPAPGRTISVNLTRRF